MLDARNERLDHVAVAESFGSYLMVPLLSYHKPTIYRRSVTAGLITLQPYRAKSSLPAGKYALFKMRQRKSGRAQIL